MGPKRNHKCPYKRGAEGDLTQKRERLCGEGSSRKGEGEGFEVACLLALKIKRKP